MRTICTVIRMIESRRMSWAEHVKHAGGKMNVYGKPEGKGPLGKLRRGWKISINTDFKLIEWDAMG
jgi:hypothetical protein